MHRGYIKLWRKLRDNPMWLSEPFTHGQALVDLFMLANHKQNIVMIRGIQVTVEPGQVVAGEQYLGDRWRWSRGKVRRFLRNLAQQNDAPIDLQTNNVISVIAITNWELYQASDTTDDTANSTTDGQQKNNRRTTDGHTEECKETTRREKKPRTPSEPLPEPPTELAEAWGKFLKMRREIRKPVTPTAAKEQLDNLSKYPVAIANAMLLQSVKNQWQGVFDLKDEHGKPKKPQLSSVEYAG